MKQFQILAALTTIPTYFRYFAVSVLGAATLAILPPALKAAEPVKAVKGSLFRPADFTSLGVCKPAAKQTVTFDTGTKDRPPTVSGAVTGKGALGVTGGGQVQAAVFVFDEISFNENTTVVITGERGLVLVSKGGIDVSTPISVSGADGTPGKSGLSGPGAVSIQPIAAGFGGSYGGVGGNSSAASGGAGKTPASSPIGKPYGDPSLADLVGGCAGAGAPGGGGGGGGGGAIALISPTKIAIMNKGAVLADGGAGGVARIAGGGGSGGSILLSAPEILFRFGGRISVKGGAGGSGGPGVEAEITSGVSPRQTGSGGGGGGGRIAAYIPEDLGAKGKDQPELNMGGYFGVDVDGGDGGFKAQDGEMGSMYDGTLVDLK